MELFLNYNDNNFIDSFKDALNIERLIKTSVQMSDRQINEQNIVKYEKECCLDFAGVSASLLHEDGSDKYLEDIFKNINCFLDEKIRLHFRFLLVYPFSAHAIARIQAEESRNRATILEPTISKTSLYGFDSVDAVDMHIFTASNFVKKQHEFLRMIGQFMDSYRISRNGDNRLVIRFIPTAVNVCMYRFNNFMYISPYLLAKERRVDTMCVEKAPVIYMNRSNDNIVFEAYIDHFRYLWGLPQTIYLEDATDYKCCTGVGDITKIKPPHEIDFSVKAKRIKSKSHSTDLASWKKQVKDLLNSLCPVIPVDVQKKHSIFIACSWNAETSSPNLVAQKLEKWLKKDFGKTVGIDLVDAKGGASINKNIYKNLNSSTVGLILFTCDLFVSEKKIIDGKEIKGRYYAKPNIYHELGYLMGKYEAKGYDNKMVIPIVQRIGDQTVYYPSNVADKVYFQFQDEKIEAKYEKIILLLQELLSLDISIICYALKCHEMRLRKMLLDGDVDARELLIAVDLSIKNINCSDCEKDNCHERVIGQSI